MHDTTTSQDIIEKVEQVLHEYDFDLNKLVCLSTDGAENMVGRHNGVVAKLQAENNEFTSGFVIYTFFVYYSTTKIVFEYVKIGSCA